VRDNRVNYVVVGLFVLASLAGLVVAVAMLTGRTGATDDYYAVYGNVTGVKFGTQVFYEGYPIGQVETVTPQQNAGRMEFRVDFSVIEDWRIPDDSVVHIAAPSLLSAKALDIRAGDSPDPLEPGARVTSVEAADVFAVVNDVAAEFQSLSRDSVRPLLANLNDAVLNIDSMVSGDRRDHAGADQDAGGSGVAARAADAGRHRNLLHQSGADVDGHCRRLHP
jgi:phospholipid/cholesterol/gamma-HCH transport system substrate-binding protein